MNGHPDGPSGTLSEVYIQDCFHSYLRSSLAQAKAERLLPVDVLASAESDLMITGPALCLFFAAIRSTTNPPSVPLPRLDKTMPPAELSPTNCPPPYAPFLRVWSNTVEPIQSLAPERQHDLARLICNLEPLTPAAGSAPGSDGLSRIAADLRAVAIEISQRRSFQERYQTDLQAAIDSSSGGDGAGGGGAGGGGASGLRVRASFQPPPAYDPTPSPTTASPHPSPRPSPHSPAVDLPPVAPLNIHRRTPSAGAFAFPVPSIPGGGVPGSPTHERTTSSGSASAVPAAIRVGGAQSPPQSPGLLSPSWSQSSFAGSSSGAPHSPSLISSQSPAIELIRETLYASLADVLERSPSLRLLLKTDPPRAYFGSVALAVLEVATSAVTREGSVVGVMGNELTVGDCPPPLRPLMVELAAIGRGMRTMEEEDSLRAVEALQAGEEPGEPRAERLRQMLEAGVGAHDAAERDGERVGRLGERGRSQEGRALAFANRVNGLALRMTQLRPFRERQQEVFKVLAGVGG